MAIQYKRGYGPQYTVHGKTLSSLHLKRTWGIKVPVEEEPNQPPLTLVVCFISPPLYLSLLLRGLSRKFDPGIPNTLILNNILDKSNIS